MVSEGRPERARLSGSKGGAVVLPPPLDPGPWGLFKKPGLVGFPDNIPTVSEMPPLAGKRKTSAFHDSPMKKKPKAASYSGQQAQRRVSGPRYMLMRYKALGGLITLPAQNLVYSCGIVETNQTNAYSLNESIRIHHIRVLGKPPQGATDISEVAVEFAGGDNRGDNDRVVNSSNNPNIAPRLYVKPSRYATASDWVNHGVTSTMATIQAPAGSIIEIGMMVTGYEEGSTMKALTVSGGSAGRFNYLRPSNQLEVIA